MAPTARADSRDADPRLMLFATAGGAGPRPTVAAQKQPYTIAHAGVDARTAAQAAKSNGPKMAATSAQDRKNLAPSMNMAIRSSG